MTWRQAKQTANSAQALQTVTLYLLTGALPGAIVTTLQQRANAQKESNMDKGIRTGVKFEFNRLLAERATIGNKAFRKQIIFWAVENYGCTVAAACTHYNHAFQECKKTNPELVEGLGRPPEKNNGGRKKKEVAPELVGPVQPAATLVSSGIVPHTATQVVTTNPADVVEEQQTVFKVCKKSDGTVIAEGLSFEDAKALVEKAAAAKKAKLYWM